MKQKKILDAFNRFLNVLASKVKIRFNIRTKILGAFMVGIVFLVFICGTAITRMDSINSSSKNMAESYVPSIKLLGELSTNITEYRRQELRSATVTDSGELVAVESKMVNLKSKIDALAKEYEEKYENTDDNKKTFETFKSTFGKYQQKSRTALELAKFGDTKGAIDNIVSSESDFASSNSVLSNIIVIHYSDVVEEAKKSEDMFNSSRFIFLIMSILCVIVSMGIGILISFNISRPITKLDRALKSIAQGDLTIDEVRINNKDEVGSLAESFNKMVVSFKDIVRNVHISAEQVSSSAEELTASVEQTSKSVEEINGSVMEVTLGVENQSKDMEDVLKTFDEINKGLTEMAVTIEGSSSTSMKAAQDAKDGQNIVDSAVNHMKSISSQVNVILNTMGELKKKSNNIEGIVSTISAIANQTNLLALNAAIEAARAGESGRGFAVVADEVKKLAAQSAKATKEIGDIINNIKKDIDSAEGATQNGTKAVGEGLIVINKAGEAFKNIVQSIEKVAMQSQEIAATSEEIASGSDQVKESIGRTSGISKDTSANMESVAASVEQQSASMQQLAALAQSLGNMSVELSRIVGSFKI